MGIDQHDEGVVGKVIGEQPKGIGFGVRFFFDVFAADRGDFDFVDRFDTALATKIEAADRFNLVPKPLDPERIWLIGRKNIEDTATSSKFAWKLDCRRCCESGFGKRLSEFGSALAKRR